MSTFKKLHQELVMASNKPPRGAMTLEQIAEHDLECGVDNARRIMAKLVSSGKVKKVMLKQINAAGAMIQVAYYVKAEEAPVAAPVPRKR